MENKIQELTDKIYREGIEKGNEEAQKLIAKAEAEAEAIIIAAEAQAEANQLLSQSLTPSVLSQMYYEKWDGKLPYLYGANSNSIIQVPTN